VSGKTHGDHKPLEQILRREDIICKSLLDAASPMFNTPISFTNFTPQVLSTMYTNVSRWGTPAATLLLAWDQTTGPPAW